MKKFVIKRISESQGFLNHDDIEVEIRIPETGKYVVDDSQFVPISEALKQLDNYAPASKESLAQYYDFPDGKDTGISVPITRQPRDSSDVTEVVSAITEKVSEIAQTKANLEFKIKADKEFTDKVNKLSGNSKSD